MSLVSESAEATLNAYEHDSLSFSLNPVSPSGPTLTIAYRLKGAYDFDGRVRQYVESLLYKMRNSAEQQKQTLRAFSAVLGKESVKIQNQSLGDESFATNLGYAIVNAFNLEDRPLAYFVDAVKKLDPSTLSLDHPLRSEPYPQSERAANFNRLEKALDLAKGTFEGVFEPSTGKYRPRLNCNAQEGSGNSCTVTISGAEIPITGSQISALSQLLVKEGLLTRARRPDIDELVNEKMPAPQAKQKVITTHRF